MAAITESEPIPSVKDLASSESSIRRSALRAIVSHLNEREATSPLTPTQSLQLWRGLYVAVYMHDSKNAISVQNLITEVAGLLSVIAAKDKAISTSGGQDGVWLDTWTTAFWETISREWVSIDQWRMNKVLLLVRFFLRENLRLLFDAVAVDEPKSSAKSHEIVTRQVHVLESWPLSPRERKVPDGLRLHVLDVWSDELLAQLEAATAAAAVQGGQESSSESGENGVKNALTGAAKLIMAPVEKISKEALSKGVKMRAKDAVKSFQESI
ncbi:uncharacterized protein A1O9_11243 [Exophiala aquamarina CBS 119918]|uniref:Ribosomal RNA-processing protein 1 n=1 Tax=Exophiala aquamarina CBS 119918 TaxID=1182545 RepID=A0A072NZ28_9EURO|nr:uncharacterized protein A1O9_11243 [Exophiala aquamarina CBS 119918]KEF52826.1 hypothetical protein A1O9_11243 [Exophiala aquamarina CBS 119918]